MFGTKTLKVALIGTTALIGVSFLTMPTAAQAAPPCNTGTTTIASGTTGPIILCAGAALTVSNSGSITGGQTGVDDYGNAISSITNHGHITGSETGIYANAGSSMVSLTNSGSVLAQGNGSSEYGVEFYGTTVFGDFNNSGSIRAVATTSGGSAYGIYMSSTTLIGALKNSGTVSGTITGSGTGSESYYGDGVFIYDSKIGSIDNAAGGRIIGSATGTSTATAYAYGNGLYLYDSTVYGALTNEGTISGTAVTSGAEYGYESYANGIYLYDTTVGGGLGIINDGRITATASSDSTNSYSAYAYAHGLYLYDSTVNGSLINNGSIVATATATSPTYYAEAYAYGLYMYSGTINGALTNMGTITATAISNNTSPLDEYNEAWAYGMMLTYVVTGAVTNGGTITATATATIPGSYDESNYAYAYGMYLDSTTISGAMTNSGTITATATAKTTSGAPPATESYYPYAYAYGLYLEDSTMSGALMNEGTITATASTSVGTDSTDGYGYAYAYGLYLYESTVGGLGVVNDGTISASASVIANSYGYYAYAYGMYFSSADIASGLTNNGTISATATGTALTYEYPYAYAYGIYLDDSTVAGPITNNGTITATATANGVAYGYAYAYGIGVSSSTIGGLTNNAGGVITATATATSSKSDYPTAYAYGVYFDQSTIAGDVVNGGTITASATAKGPYYGYDAYAYGISLTSSSTSGMLANTGTITASATTTTTTSEYGDAYAYGVYLESSTLGGALNNSGTISATARAIGASTCTNSCYGYAYAWGIYLYDSTIATGGLTNTNTGTISATAIARGPIYADEATAWGIYMHSSSITGNLTNNGTISANATATATKSKSAFAYATGIYMDPSEIDGDVVNTGTIAAVARATGTDRATASAWGISEVGTSLITGSLINSGTISAKAYANAGTTGKAYATGIYVGSGSDITTGIVNSGTISGYAQGSSFARGVGIYVASSQITGGITNNVGGVISGKISTGGTGSAYGIYMTNLSGATPIIINGGSIIGDVFDDGAVANDFSPVTVNGSTQTQGDWTVSNLNVTGGGNLIIGAGDTFTTQRMTTASTGTYTFGVGGGANGLLVPAVAFDMTNATVNGLVVGAKPANGSQFLIVTGGGAIVGGPGGTLTAANSSYLWNFSIEDDTGADILNPTVPGGTANDLWLIVNQNHTCGGLGSVTNSDFCSMLENTNTTDPTLLALIEGVNGAGSAAQIDSIISTAVPTVDGSDFAGAFNVDDETMGLTDERLAYLRTGEGDGMTGMAAGNMPHGVGMWGQVFGRHADQNDQDGVPGYTADTWGGAVGVDTRNISDHTIFGLAFSYGRTDANSSNANDTDTTVDAYQLTLYGNWQLHHDYYLNGAAAYSWDSINRDRHNAAGTGLTAHGDYNASTWAVNAEAGRDFHEGGGMTLTPNLTANWLSWDPDSYTETGAGGADMHIDGQTLDKLEIGAGVKAGWNLHGMQGSTIKPQLRAGYRYAVVNDRIEDTAQFTGGGGAFDIRGIEPDRSTVDLGASVKLMTTRNWDFTGSYDFNWRSDYTSHAGYLRAGYKF